MPTRAAGVVLRVTLAAIAVSAGVACSGTPAAARGSASSAVAAQASAAAPAVVAAARFDIETAGGRIARIVMRPAGRDERYVFDGFVDDDDAVRDEARRTAARPARPAFCAALGEDDAQCRRTCGWAEATRPFTQITRLTGDGKRHVLSTPESPPMRLNAGAGSHSNEGGDCLSPDARYLSVYATIGDSGSGAARAMIVELAAGLPAARFVGQHSGKTYGEDRDFDFAGWETGKPHVLRFSWGGGEEPLDDVALPR